MTAASPSIQLAVDEDLVFRFDLLHPLLADAVRQHLPYFLKRTPQPGCQTLHISGSLPGPPFRPRIDTLLLRSGDLRIFRRDEDLYFEVPGIRGWCRPSVGLAGIRAHQPTARMARLFVNLALGSMLIEMALPRGLYGVHAAALALRGRGVLLPGPSGCGKSTIFRNAAQYGFQLLSDDLVWLREQEGGFQIAPFPHLTDGGFCPTTIERAPLHAMVFPEIHHHSHNTIRTLDLASSLKILIQQSGFLTPGSLAGARFGAMVRAAAAVPRFRLSAGPRREEIPTLLEQILNQPTETRNPEARFVNPPTNP